MTRGFPGNSGFPSRREWVGVRVGATDRPKVLHELSGSGHPGRDPVLEKLILKNFTVFTNAEIAFTRGINVFIGANSTGKTHAMKAAYSLIKATHDHDKKRSSDTGPGGVPVDRVAEKLSAVFRPERGNVGRLIQRSPARGKATIGLEVGGGAISCEVTGPDRARVRTLGNVIYPASLFLPAREVLSIYPGFLAAYQNRELAFDETYYDLCLALSATPLRGKRAEEAAALCKPLAEKLKSNVVLEQDAFYLSMEDDGLIEAHLAAEGFRKVASLMHLIANGSLTRDSVLFWDEPETNLNPRLTRIIAEFLFRLADHGVQVVIATHDYLLTNELSLHAEYQTDAAVQAPLRFFAFSRGKAGRVSVQPGDTLVDLSDNPIMEEFQALYDRERKLFYQRDPAK